MCTHTTFKLKSKKILQGFTRKRIANDDIDLILYKGNTPMLYKISRSFTLHLCTFDVHIFSVFWLRH